MVAAALGWPLHSCDDAFDRHMEVAGFSVMPVGERLAQPIAVQVEKVFRMYRAEFPLILDELPDPAVVEGAALLPSLVSAAGVPPSCAVWIVPTEAFQRHHYGQRGWALDLVAGLPPTAFDRWMRRDAQFAVRVAAEARSLGYRVITVDGTVAIAELAADVLAHHSPQGG
ncbi:hypothetical protein JIG36_30540 [Actinoplanes sp. LDG1-06]|uniref:Uncharacterized protein n=1 Tax=Paractinoplanes ovalisporus TaxID=2810368 RepID=A0ABS2AJ25_9ACTN|nr:hypothetical protein [Actinoplanes ovalisporus]MBM2619858.1 hypothetical protein [Actinoplanes ovalisporus]